MNDLSVFENAEFGKVRALTRDGEPWFVAADVCRALGIDPTAVRRLDDDEKMTLRLMQGESNRTSDTNVINEPGLYTLVLGSRKPEAKAFKRWITHEVIPSIRKHGAYVTEATMDNIINDPDFGIRLLQELKTEREQRTKFEQKTLLLEQENKVLEAEAEVLRPKASYYDLILQSPDAMPITEIAKDYGMSACKLNRILSDLRVQYRIRDTWVLFGAYHDKGYTKLSTYITPSGAVRNHTCWTQKGREFLYTLLKANGILPMIEQK